MSNNGNETGEPMRDIEGTTGNEPMDEDEKVSKEFDEFISCEEMKQQECDQQTE
ncbi:6425_t:CDS:1, partial [Acaulospora morrowiae]